MKTIISIFFLIGLPIMMGAQTEESMHLSLDQSIAIGLKNRYDQKADRYNIGRAENQINKRKKTWIPNIEATGNVQYIPEIEPLYIPKNALGNDKAKLGDIGAHAEMAFGLSLSQPIVQPGIQTDIHIAKNKRDLAQEEHRGREMELKNSIARAYYQVLLKKMQYEIAQDETKRFRRYMNMVKGKYKNGVMIKNDYRRARLDYKNTRINKATAKQNYRLAQTHLKHQINVPEETRLTLTDSLEKIPFKRIPGNSDEAIEKRSEIRQLKLKERGNKLHIKKAKKYALPTISLVGGYAQKYQNQNFHYDETKWWAPHSFVGVNISIPLTGNISNKNKIKDYKLKEKQLKMNMQQKKSDVRYEVDKARTDLDNALSNMSSAKDNYTLSQEVYDNQQKQFSIGAFQYSDLLDTEKSVHQSEVNYIQEVYNYLMAKITYRKALGEL